MSSCFGFRKRAHDLDQEPLLPQYHDDTALQQRLHQKLHSYQMVRAISKGFMPSNEQLVINLRTLLASDILNPDDSSVTDSGRLLAKYSRKWLHQFIDLLLHKNSGDQLQDFIWFLVNSRLSLDTDDIAQRASKVKAKADNRAAYQSLRTVGSLLLTNSDFRLFLSDLQTVAQQIFRDSAFATSKVAHDMAEKADPSTDGPNGSALAATDARPPPSKDDLIDTVQDASKTVADAATTVGSEAQQSAVEHLSGDQRDTLIKRLQGAVGKLRQRPDYNDSVSTITLLLKRYAFVYSRAAEESVDAVRQDVDTNDEVDYAVNHFWSLLTSFGDPAEWDELKKRFKAVAEHQKHNQDFEQLVTEIANAIQKILTDPDFFSQADEKFQELREKSQDAGNDTSIKHDVTSVLDQLRRTAHSVAQDKDVSNLVNTTLQAFNILSPTHSAVNQELFTDAINVFGPLLIQAIQYIPIPRLEISVPEIDLLLENLILEPGQTVNNSSFLPFRLRVETYNDLEIRKARMRTVSKTTSLFTVKLDGLSVRADDVGFWMRAHSGILRLADEGIASFHLDDRGVDIHLDVEVGKDRLESLLSLKAVRVKIHHLSYRLRKSKLSWIAWLFKPIVRPILRKVLERQAASAIADAFHAANRELLFARERLRATRIADPQDMLTFFKAVAARLTPADDPDVSARVGVAQPGHGVFKGVYAPGSVVKLWNEQGDRAAEVVDDYSRDGWRNAVFDVAVASA